MATRTAPAPTPTVPTSGGFFGHPRGLATLFFTEMWERFSYYGMRALLILYMTAAATDANAGLGWEEGQAGAAYGLYTSLVYLLALPGGWVADRLWGQRKAVFVGFDLFKTDLPLRVAFPLILANSLRWLQPVGLEGSDLMVAAGAPGATSFYVIVEGTVDVVKQGAIANQLGPGAFFGELGVIDGGRRNASIVATSDVTALRMTRAAFKKVMSEEPGIAYRVMESLVARIRAAEPRTNEDTSGD